MLTKLLFKVFLVFVVLSPFLCGCGDKPRDSAIIPADLEATPVRAEALATQPGVTDATVIPSPAPTITPSPTPLPTPTPTLVPLPKTCLRPEFTTDLGNCGDVPHYDIALTVDPAAAQVSGHQEIRYTNTENEPLRDIYLRLFPNAPGYGGYMTVTHLIVAERSVTPSLMLEGSALRIPLTPTLRAGHGLTLSMDFRVDVPTSAGKGHALFSYLRGVMSLPTVYPMIPVYDDEGWNVEIAPEYGDDVYADIAAYQVEVTAPADFRLIVSGSCTSTQQESETRTWTCEAGPMRDFAMILGDNYQQVNQNVGGVVVNSYFYSQHERGGHKALMVAADALAAFTDLFGPYPYAELDVVETPNHLGGMEYSGLVVVSDSLYPGVAGVEWLTAHEVAHQWWYAVVGSDQIDEPWLDEALTQYSTMLYYENVYGAERAAGVLNAEFMQTHNSLKRRGQDLVVGLPAEAYGPRLYWEIVYDKGALYFHNLREAVGDEDFFRILQVYYDQHRYKIATPEDFLETVDRVTGDAHLELFEQWVAAPSGSP